MAHILRVIISRTSSKVKVTKVKNVKILVFSLVSESVVQGQGHKGQGHPVKVKVIGQGQRCLGNFAPRRLVGGVTRGHLN